MKEIRTLVLGLLLALPGVGQEKGEQASLIEIITWMTNFSATHGFMHTSTVTQTNKVFGTIGCTIEVSHTFPQATRKDQLKFAAEYVELGDLDPRKVRMEVGDYKDGHTFEVDFERSDAAAKIVQAMEFGDKSQTKAYLSHDYLFFDSTDSAKRFATALSHAIRLCGGTPAPF